MLSARWRAYSSPPASPPTISATTMTMMRMTDCRLSRREPRCFSANDGGGGGGVRRICWVGDASAGDGGLGIFCVGPTSAGRYGGPGRFVRGVGGGGGGGGG